MLEGRCNGQNHPQKARLRLKSTILTAQDNKIVIHNHINLVICVGIKKSRVFSSNFNYLDFNVDLFFCEENNNQMHHGSANIPQEPHNKKHV